MRNTPPQANSLFSSLFSSDAQQEQRTAKAQKSPDWWGPIWRGLPVDPGSKHYHAMHTSVWLYLYLVIHADRATGALFRMVPRISGDMGIPPRTIRRWLARLKRGDYISVRQTGRSLHISIQKWKPLRIRPGSKAGLHPARRL